MDSGLLTIAENRENINAISNYYLKAYQKCEKEKHVIERKNDDFKRKAKLFIFNGKMSLIFTKPPIKNIGKLALSLAKPITCKISDLVSKIKKNKITKKEVLIKEDFLNFNGDVSKFEEENPELYDEIKHGNTK